MIMVMIKLLDKTAVDQTRQWRI